MKKDYFKRINDIEIKNLVFKDYVINKNVFRVCLLISLILLISILSAYNFDFNFTSYYVNCPVDSLTDCINPYYYDLNKGFCVDESVCRIKFISKGDSIGYKTPYIVSSFGNVLLLIFFFGFVINHLFYNRKVKK